MASRKTAREKIGRIEEESIKERLYATLDLADSLQAGKTQEAKDIERVLKSINDDSATQILQARLEAIGENQVKSESEILEDIKLLGYTLAEVAYHGLGKMAGAEIYQRTGKNGGDGGEDATEESDEPSESEE